MSLSESSRAFHRCNGTFLSFYTCLQITELLDDERCEAECEELPQDGEEGPASLDSPQHTQTDDSPSARWDTSTVPDVIMVSCLGSTSDSLHIPVMWYIPRFIIAVIFFNLLNYCKNVMSADGSSTLQDQPLHIRTHAPTQHMIPSRHMTTKLAAIYTLMVDKQNFMQITQRRKSQVTTRGCCARVTGKVHFHHIYH